MAIKAKAIMLETGGVPMNAVGVVADGGDEGGNGGGDGGDGWKVGGGERTAVVVATTAVMKVMLLTRVQWR